MTNMISFIWHLIKANIVHNFTYGSSVEVGVGSGRGSRYKILTFIFTEGNQYS